MSSNARAYGNYAYPPHPIARGNVSVAHIYSDKEAEMAREAGREPEKISPVSTTLPQIAGIDELEDFRLDKKTYEVPRC